MWTDTWVKSSSLQFPLISVNSMGMNWKLKVPLAKYRTEKYFFEYVALFPPPSPATSLLPRSWTKNVFFSSTGRKDRKQPGTGLRHLVSASHGSDVRDSWIDARLEKDRMNRSSRRCYDDEFVNSFVDCRITSDDRKSTASGAGFPVDFFNVMNDSRDFFCRVILSFMLMVSE